MQPKAEPCPEREVLESRFRADVRLYLDAVDRLGPASAADFKVLHEAAESARLEVQNLRLALKAHILEPAAARSDVFRSLAYILVTKQPGSVSKFPCSRTQPHQAGSG